MKLALFAALSATAAHLVAAHYTFPYLITGSSTATAWQYVRQTANFDSQAPVTNVSDPSLRCYEESYTTTAAATSTISVAAGSTIGFEADNSIYHPGIIQVYLSAASPAANSPNAGTGATWFKIYEDLPTWTASGGFVWPSQTITQFTITLPSNLPNGQYLIRVEQIALHVASTFGGAQFYIACGQLTVTGGGTGTPSPLVSIPGVYTGHEPGILIDIYGVPANYTGYTAPGPAVWK